MSAQEIVEYVEGLPEEAFCALLEAVQRRRQREMDLATGAEDILKLSPAEQARVLAVQAEDAAQHYDSKEWEEWQGTELAIVGSCAVKGAG